MTSWTLLWGGEAGQISGKELCVVLSWTLYLGFLVSKMGMIEYRLQDMTAKSDELMAHKSWANGGALGTH